jgi:hypothetical protein
VAEVVIVKYLDIDKDPEEIKSYEYITQDGIPLNISEHGGQCMVYYQSGDLHQVNMFVKDRIKGRKND